MSENSQEIFGQGGCFAFHPVYSGDCKYTTGIFKFMKNKPTGTNPESIWEESSSIDDCIQIAIWRIIPFCEVRNIFVVIYDQNSKSVKTYTDTDDLIKDLWKSFSNIPFDDGEKDLVLGQDWFIFEKGTERKDIWKWFDSHYSSNHVILRMNRVESILKCKKYHKLIHYQK